MADMENFRQSLNPLVLQLKKMELELKCLKCLDLMSSPMLLPCDHLFCSNCIVTFTETLKCPMCLLSCYHQDVRPATHVKKMIHIYKSMNTILGANLMQQWQQVPSVNTFGTTKTKMLSSKGPILGNKNIDVKAQEAPVDKLSGNKSNVVHPNTKNPRDEVYESKKRTINSGDEPFADGGEAYSPPSFGNIKGSDNDSNGQCTEHKAKRSLANSLSEDANVKFKQAPDDSVVIDILGRSNTQPLHAYNNSATSIMECAFCHSFRTHEGCGKMLHYLNGNPVSEDQASQADVLHAHEKCINWAPQVYYDGETAKNLEVELSRASKIKCSHCGLKGAALGCYMKSCSKSYHVPCAVEIPECRWDCENYLVLCPAHTSHKLPCDKSKKTKKIKTNDSGGHFGSSEDLAHASMQPCREKSMQSNALGKDLILCGSALSKEEKVLLDSFASLCGAAVVNSWKNEVTHVIASTDEHGACSRTLKVLMAILSGKWVLNIDWVKACMDARHPVAEEPYEVSHDVHGCFDGPKNGRIRAMEKAPKLFNGLSFHFTGSFDPSYKGNLENLVTAGGGTLCDDLNLSNPRFIVYNSEPPVDCWDPNCAEEFVRKQAEDAEALAAKAGSRAVPRTWILDASAACSLSVDQ